ncbi:helix-turn-helix domain-containing protein [Candidatus Poribacteria bacterium]|nr:helix-turn-helix domain-containing protein [Candidatus Poribacteria bacterium]
MEVMVNPPVFEDEFLTTKQLAQALKKNLATIQRWCREGKLPAVKIEGSYIIRKKDFEEWYVEKLSNSKTSLQEEQG